MTSNGRSWSWTVFQPIDDFTPEINYARDDDYLRFESIRGRVMHITTNQAGCKFLERAIQGYSSDEVYELLMELGDYIGHLMLDRYGNYLVSKIVSASTQRQMSYILSTIMGGDGSKFLIICQDYFGNRVIQGILDNENTSSADITLMINALSSSVVEMTKSPYAHHVIKLCLNKFSFELNQELIAAMANDCVTIGSHKTASFLLELGVERSGEANRLGVLHAIMKKAPLMAKDHIGNFVLLKLVKLYPFIIGKLISELTGHYPDLSCHRYGSWVVRKCLYLATPRQANEIISEFMTSESFPVILSHSIGYKVLSFASLQSKCSLSGELQLKMRERN